MNEIPTHRYLTFFGQIRPPATQNLRSALCTMVNERAEKVTILFASPGGSTDDGIALYVYLKALPIELEMHAIGFVSSIAIPVFLAAPIRRASANARFFFHEFSWVYGNATELTQTSMKDHAMQLESARAWAIQVSKSQLKLDHPEFEIAGLFKQPRLVEPSLAADIGLVLEVSEPAIAAGGEPRVVM